MADPRKNISEKTLNKKASDIKELKEREELKEMKERLKRSKRKMEAEGEVAQEKKIETTADTLLESLIDGERVAMEKLSRVREKGEDVEWKKVSAETTKFLLGKTKELLKEEMNPQERAQVLEELAEKLNSVKGEITNISAQEEEKLRTQMNQQQADSYLQGMKKGVDEWLEEQEFKVGKAEINKKVVKPPQEESLSKEEKERREEQRNLQKKLDKAKDVEDYYPKLRETVEKRETPLNEEEVEQMKEKLGKDTLVDLYLARKGSGRLTEEEEKRFKETSDYIDKYY